MIAAIEIAVGICKEFEGFSSAPYLDPIGIPTIGYGTVYKPDGSKVTMAHPPISRELAEQWLVDEIKHNYMTGVLQASPSLIRYPKALGAITSFAYNLGVARYRASTLRRKIDVQDWQGAREQIVRWDRAGGKVLRGLTRRRLVESFLL
jgi:lysozyme